MKMVKKLSLLLAVVMLIGSMGLTALAGSYLGSLRVVNCQEWVTLRSGPSTSAGTVCKVPLGAVVDGYYYNTEFTECYYNGYHGYILSTYLSSASSGTAAGYNDYLGKKTIVNCNEFVTLRAQPSTSAAAVTRVALGQTVDAYYYNSTFSYCYYNGLSGYILNDYLGGSYSYTPSVSYGRVYQGIGYIVNCDQWVSLRSSPSTSASRLCEVPLGAVVEVYSCNSQFSECYYDGCWGFILNEYISFANGGYNYAYVVNCDQWVSLRSSPSTSAPRLREVPLGAIVECYDYNYEFSQCYYDGCWGFILNEYLVN